MNETSKKIMAVFKDCRTTEDGVLFVNALCNRAHAWDGYHLELLDESIEELLSSGFVRETERGSGLILTREGYRFLHRN